MKTLLVVFVSLFALVVDTGCFRKITKAAPSSAMETQIKVLTKAFQPADAQLKAMAEAACSALRQNEFEKAWIALAALRSSVSDLNSDQIGAVRAAVQQFKWDLATAASNGDERAAKAMELVRFSSGR